MWGWAKKAICRDSGVNFLVKEVTPEIASLCGACPVREECLKHAIEHEEYDIWAGTTPDERQVLRKKAGFPKPTPERLMSAYFKPIQDPDIPHGTTRGYHMHRKRGQAACEECLQSRRAKQKV